MQATTTSEIHNGGVASSSLVKSEAESTGDNCYSTKIKLCPIFYLNLRSYFVFLCIFAVRRRSSSSIGLPPDENLPSVMQVIGCVNEEGLGLVSWWSSS